ncbi:OmpH family outer membrane protein [Desulfococcaceae bacterium HSG8]|nr:OmpH family outer membrane protein [Desulfococcaceae bacterium HSG8]
MRTFKTAFFVAILAFFFFAASSYGADVANIGIVDIQRVVEESSAGKKIKAEITQRGKEMEADLKKKGTEIEGLKKKLEREAAVMSPDQRQKRAREVDIKIYDFKALKKQYNEELLKFQNKKLDSMRKDIYEVVQEMGKRGGYLLIVEKIGVLYYPKTIDVTDELVKMYNARYAGK